MLDDSIARCAMDQAAYHFLGEIQPGKPAPYLVDVDDDVAQAHEIWQRLDLSLAEAPSLPQ